MASEDTHSPAAIGGEFWSFAGGLCNIFLASGVLASFLGIPGTKGQFVNSDECWEGSRNQKGEQTSENLPGTQLSSGISGTLVLVVPIAALGISNRPERYSLRDAFRHF